MNDTYEETPCHMCGNDDLLAHNEIVPMIFCDGEDCNRVFHSICLGLTPKKFRKLADSGGKWRCPGCVVNGTPYAKTPARDPKKLVYYYTRVSSKGQDNLARGRAGLATQTHAIKAFASQHGLTLVEAIQEVGSAWKNTDKLCLMDFVNSMHPHAISRGMRKAEIVSHLDACNLPSEGTVEHLLSVARNAGLLDKVPSAPILVFSCDRVSRNVEYAREIVNAARSVGSYFASVTEGVNSDDASFWGHIQAGEAYSRALSMNATVVRARLAGTVPVLPEFSPLKVEAIQVENLSGQENCTIDSLCRVYKDGRVIGIWENDAIRTLTPFEILVCKQMGVSTE